jgi:hypothetical protein
MAVAAATSTDTVPPIVTRNKHRPGRFQSRRRPASGDGSGTGTTGFAPASENKKFGAIYRTDRVAALGGGQKSESRGVEAVIGLIRQIHSYERRPNLRRPKADVEGGIRVVFFK